MEDLRSSDALECEAVGLVAGNSGGALSFVMGPVGVDDVELEWEEIVDVVIDSDSLVERLIGTFVECVVAGEGGLVEEAVLDVSCA